MQVSCVRIHCPWLHPVTVISFARIHCSWVNTTNQSQGSVWEVSIILAYTAGSAPPPHRCSAGSYLVRYVHAQTVNNGGEQTRTTETKNAPLLKKMTDEESSVKRKNWTEPERQQGYISEHHFRGGGSCRICEDSRELDASLLDR